MVKGKVDNAEFDRVMTLAYAFDENAKQDGPKVSWEEIKAEIAVVAEELNSPISLGYEGMELNL